MRLHHLEVKPLLIGEQGEADPAIEEDGGGLRDTKHPPAKRLEEGCQSVLQTKSIYDINQSAQLTCAVVLPPQGPPVKTNLHTLMVILQQVVVLLALYRQYRAFAASFVCKAMTTQTRQGGTL